MISITTLGGLSVHAQGRDVTALLGNPRHRALLVYLAVEREAPRDALLSLVWPRLSGGHARRELSRALHELTRLLGHWVTAEGGLLRVADSVDVDVLALVAARERGAPSAALHDYHGDFLPDLRADGQPLLEQWLHERRAAVRTMQEQRTDGVRDVAPADSLAPAAASAAPKRRPGLLRVIGELQRRRVFRVAAAYAVAAFVIGQAADLLVSGLPLPDWVMRLTLILLMLGFPVALGLAWLFELTDEGEVRWEQPGGIAPAFAWTTRSPWRITAAAAVLLALGVAAAWGTYRWPLGRGDTYGELDDGRVVVLPFERADGVRSELDEAQSLYDALSRWAGIVVVDLFQVRDALGPLDVRLTPRNAREVAASLGAARFTRGSVSRQGNQLRIHAVLHDTRTGGVLADASAQYSGSGLLADSVYMAIADALLFKAAGVRNAGTELIPATQSFPARVAFERAQEALQTWDLERADGEFATALELDPDYGRAALWRAQVQTWSGRTPEDVRVLAERAAAARDRLLPREAALADGLRFLAYGDFQNACAAYAGLRDNNERDFAAWYGLGECHGNDNVVQADASTASGWAFRSSYHQAIEAYRRAFSLLPSAHRGFRSRTFERVRQLLFTSTERIRVGRAPGESVTFLARPSLVEDTFVFVPFPAADFASARPGTRPATHFAAIERQRGIFHQIATSWVSAFPESPDALEALAVAEELRGDVSALTTLRLARERAETPADRMRMGAREVLLLVKFGVPDRPDDLRRAGRLADSILQQGRAQPFDDATPMAAIAALTGRVFEAAGIARRTARTEPGLGPAFALVTGSAAVLGVYAALGGPADSIMEYESQVEGAIQNRIPPEERAATRHAQLDQTASLAFAWTPLRGTIRLGETTSYELLRAQAALAARDSAGARALLRSIRDGRRLVRPAEMMLDAIFPEASLWSRLGDNVMATAVLDSTLEQMRWIEPAGLSHASRTASLVWALMLRADLAAAAGDHAAAARWALPVTILWADADPPLRSFVDRMRVLSDRSPRRVAAHAASRLPVTVTRRP